MRAFLEEFNGEKFYICKFKSPPVIGSIKSISFIPPNFENKNTEFFEKAIAIDKNIALIDTKISQLDEGDEKTEYQNQRKQLLINKSQLKKPFPKKGKWLKARVVGYYKEGYYFVQPLKLPTSWN